MGVQDYSTTYNNSSGRLDCWWSGLHLFLHDTQKHQDSRVEIMCFLQKANWQDLII